MLNTFIDRYVLCKKCGNPETLLVSSIYYEKKRMVCRKYVKMYRKYAKLVGTSIVLRQTSWQHLLWKLGSDDIDAATAKGLEVLDNIEAAGGNPYGLTLESFRDTLMSQWYFYDHNDSFEC